MAKLITWNKPKEELLRSRRKLVFDLEEVDIKLKKRLCYSMCIMLLPVERNPPKEVDKLEASKRKLEFKIREVDLKLKEKEERRKARNKRHDQMLENEEALLKTDTYERSEQRRKHQNEIIKKYTLKSGDTEAPMYYNAEESMSCCNNCVIF